MTEPATETKVLAAHFADCFASKSGEVVLKYLQDNFKGLKNPVFVEEDGRPYDPIKAAVRDGRRQVIDLIELQIQNHKDRDKKPIQKKAKR